MVTTPLPLPSPGTPDDTFMVMQTSAVPILTQASATSTPAPMHSLLTSQLSSQASVVTFESQKDSNEPLSRVLSPPLSHSTSPPSPHISSTHLSPLQAQERLTIGHEPSWTLGPQHRSYVHLAEPYFIGVSGGPEWEKLLASYIQFESLSSARSVSTSTPQYIVLH